MVSLLRLWYFRGELIREPRLTKFVDALLSFRVPAEFLKAVDLPTTPPGEVGDR